MSNEEFPVTDEYGRSRTAYAIHCYDSDFAEFGDKPHGLVYLTEEEYNAQMDRPNSLWRCPICGNDASWDDANYENFLGLDKE